MALAHTLGFPRIGAQRELKFALESFWRQDIDENALRAVAHQIRAQNWQMQVDAGLDFVTVGDFAYYDHVLHTLALLGALPSRFQINPQQLSLSDYFVLARGNQQHVAMEMTKWFDTNYHYLVPEWTADSRFDGGVDWLFEDIQQAQAAGFNSKVVLIGPLTLLHLGKIKSGLTHALDLLPSVIAAYQKLLTRLQQHGIQWVQIDEPILALELDQQWLAAFVPTYQSLVSASSDLPQAQPQLILATYFDGVAEHLDLLNTLPIAGIHIDAVRAPEQLAQFAAQWPSDKILSVGIIDGRNIWRADLDLALDKLTALHEKWGERLWLAPSCSLLHVPVDLSAESKLDAELCGWLAFGKQKLEEAGSLKYALNHGKDHHRVQAALLASRRAVATRRDSPRIHHSLVQNRLRDIDQHATQRNSPFPVRIHKQQAKWQLPLFPTTTIGSFPQTTAIRQARAAYKLGKLGHLDYLEKMRAEIEQVIRAQEQLGLDVLVHGEAERNDMVEYFGEQLWGYAFTSNGWVQSYGSRCVKPPLIYGDVYRAEPMTVSWSTYAQSLTEKPVKGMLTGPITMLQWSFVRDDQPRATTALQIALALRDEVHDLEAAGIGMIQIDEPALREGLPLKAGDWPDYLAWAVRAFKVCASGVADETQIHTHMCYAEFNDILPAIAAMDADVITIETSRSDMELLDAFAAFAYPNDIGPGVYDIHSPRVPDQAEILRLLQKARAVIPDARLWINPDCGLKTRGWEETREALQKMVAAARTLRSIDEADLIK